MNKTHFKIHLIILLAVFVTQCATKKMAQPHKIKIEEKVETIEHTTIIDNEYESPNQKKWVDSIYDKMDLKQKFGQLFMVAAWSNKDTIHTNEIERLIQNNKIGGIMFLQGGAGRQAKLTNKYQSLSKIPLFVAIDAEWGLSMRLDSTARFPWNMTLGAIQDKRLIEKLGVVMGNQSKRMGLHFNFAPVLDINTNPKNPIIGFRSFGESKENVTNSALALMNGVQQTGVFSTGKHFPGHGDTETDSHKTLPIVNFSKERLEDIELYPYKKLFKSGLASVMVAHLSVPSLEPRVGYPSSISYNVVTNLLQNELDFKGLIFTDALNMKGASNFKTPGAIVLEAFLAGNDILLFPEDVPLAIDKFVNAYNDSIISEKRLEKSVKKILKYKFKIGLNHYQSIDTDNLYNDLNKSENNALQYQLYENATTVLKNTNQILPIKSLTNNKIAYVKLGDDTNTSFISTLKKYTEITEVREENTTILNEKLKAFNLVIIGYHKSDKAWKKQDLSDQEIALIQEIAKNNVVILDFFVKPYTLLQIPDFENIEGLIMSYQNADIAQIVSAEMIFGAISAKGKLPVSIGSNFKVGAGLETEKLNRLGFTAAENVGMNPDILNEIDAVANKAINGKMAPGIQVLVARKGKVIYQKSYGYQTYTKTDKIENNTLFDVASVSKIISTLPNVMQLYDQKKVKLDTKLSEMLPQALGTNKDSIKFKNLLSHYARLQAWIPFYKATLDSASMPSKRYYKPYYSSDFSKKVADNLFIRNDYQDTIMKQIFESKLIDKLEYKYSDFTFILLKEFLERTTNKKLDVLSDENFYSSLGMNNTLYNPLRKFDVCDIAPTEIDTYFRHSLLQGYVHDMEAAMEGGVAGHAGVFSNAMDVAKIMQMYLQKGNYGGIEYFSDKTFDVFNTCHFCSDGNRRGLGFDKPQLSKEGPTCGCVSKKSFGHTGFTGIMTWADPETEIVYVFMSNRTFPDSMAPNKLSKENIREDIQQIIQDAIIE
jgi:beta-N-acetylhexosaminidase